VTSQIANTHQRWSESLFPTPLLFQNFGIRARIRHFFKFENPTPVQTPAAIIDPTLIYPCFYLRNDHTDFCHCRKWKMTPVRFFTNFSLRIREKNKESCRSRLWHSGSGATSAPNTNDHHMSLNKTPHIKIFCVDYATAVEVQSLYESNTSHVRCFEVIYRVFHNCWNKAAASKTFIDDLIHFSLSRLS